MFSDRVQKIFDVLGASNTDIAAFAGCDRSNISRLKSGGRVPKPSSVTTKRLIDGIFLFADDKNKTEKLLKTVSCPDNLTSDEIKNHILLWLYEGYEEQQKENKKPKKKMENPKAPFSSFGTKLDAVMDIAEISNVRLGKQLHIDVSTISRFRHGLRTPKSNQKLSNEICRALFERITELNRLDALIKFADIPTSAASDEEECFECFRGWFCDFEPKTNSVLVENLLDNISSFSADIKAPLPSLTDAAPYDIISDNKNAYYGIDGLRTAVIRFLGNAILHNAKELWLYSDQDMDWMVGDMSFRLKWTLLMMECVKKGIKIRIIHNINRNLDEMTDAINSWLPLYMSGMIESFYCKKQLDKRFSHTIFLCPDLACISSVNIAGCDDIGIYRYDIDDKMLEIYREEYKRLLDMSKQLVWVYQRPEDEKKVYSNGKGVTALSNTLSLATMPKSVLNSIIERNALDDKTSKAIISEWENKTQLFSRALENGYVHECVKTAEDELLFGGKVPVDFRTASLTYTPEEYKEHIKNIIAVSENYTGYRLYALPDTPFTNISVVISENAVTATRLLTPKITFVFSHPALCEAFLGYANHLKERYMQDKITLRRQLEGYL